MRVFFFLYLGTALSLFAKSGEEIFKTRCGSCHKEYIAQSRLISNYEHNNSELNLSAPTLTELSFQLRDQVGDRRADKESQLLEIEDFLLDYLNNPHKSKSILPTLVLQNFKTMPMLKIIEDDAEELPLYMFDFSEQMMIKHSVKRYSYKEALKKAKKENKIVMIEGYIPFCRGCIKMDREVFVEDSVKKVLNKDFVVVHENMILEKLPLGLKSLGTPSFYFITNDGKKVIDQIQGIGTVEEFLKLLHDIKEDVKRGRFFKE